MIAKGEAMSFSENWRNVFPFEDTGTVVTLIQQTWDDLVAKGTPNFNPGSKEPHLTEFLRAVLKTKKGAVGLTGHFGAEEVDSDANLVTGTLNNRSRADIRYFSDRVKVDLTFEFKKLNAKSTSLLSYYGKSGMLRFVHGKYSRDKHLAFMVGLVDLDFDKCYAALKLAIAKPKAATELQLIKSANGTYIHEPSRELPALVRFDTEHSRLTLGDQPNIMLCHIFLLYGSALPLTAIAGT